MPPISKPKNFGRGKPALSARYYQTDKDRLEAERRRLIQNIEQLEDRVEYLTSQIEGNEGEGQ